MLLKVQLSYSKVVEEEVAESFNVLVECAWEVGEDLLLVV